MSDEQNLELALHRFQDACKIGQDIFEERNRMYGNAIETTGLLGAVIELIGNTARLRQLVLEQVVESGSADFDWPAIHDTLVDIHNYAGIGLMMYEKGNIAGELS